MRLLHHRALSPFRLPGYGTYWSSLLVTSTGQWMETVAQGWLIVQLTDSPFMLGLVAGSQGLAQLSVGAFGGVIADLVDRKRLLLLAQIVRAVIALTVTLLIATGTIAIWHLALLAIIGGAVNAVQATVRHTFVYDLVGPDTLPQAVAMNMTASNVMRVVGPALGGFLLAVTDLAACYLAIAVCWSLGAIAISSIAFTSTQSPKANRSVWHNLVEGLSFVRRQRLIVVLLGAEILADTFAFSHRFLLPFYAQDILHAGPAGLGFLFSASGIGAVAGATFVGAASNHRNRGRLLVSALFIFGVLLILVSFSRSFALSCVLLFGAGGMASAFDSLMATSLQMLVTDQFRGRVMGLYVLTWGMSPMGGLQSGTVASFLGVPAAIGIGGAVAAIGALALFRLAPQLVRMPASDSPQ